MAKSLLPRSARVVLASTAMSTLGSLPAFLLGSHAVLVMRDLGFRESVLGIAVGSFFAAAALATGIAGKLADRVGARVNIAAAGLLCATGGLGLAVLVDTVVGLVVCMVVLGAGNAACQLTANIAMATAVPYRRRGLGFGVKQAAIPLAVMLGGISVPLFGTTLGWRSAFVITGVAGLMMAVSGALLLPRRRRSERPTIGEDRPPLGALLLCMTAIALASAPLNATAAYVSPWAYEVGMSPGAIGVVVAIGSAVNVVNRVVAGHLADRRQGKNLPVVAAHMAIGAVAVASLTHASPTTVVLASLVAFGVGWSWPGLMLFAVVRVSRSAPGMGSGAVQAGAFAGAAAGPLAFGYLVTILGYPPAWCLAGTAMAVGALLVLLARRMFIADLAARPPAFPL